MLKGVAITYKSGRATNNYNVEMVYKNIKLTSSGRNYILPHYVVNKKMH